MTFNQPLTTRNFKIKANDRTTIVGQTGSGKTFFAKRLLAGVQRLVVFDPKGNLAGDMNLTTYDGGIRDLKKGLPARLQIIQPIMTSSKMTDYYDETYFKELFDIGDVVIYFDETMSVVTSAQDVPPYLNAIFTQGREVRKIGVVACSQRPVRIPSIFTSEAQNYFCFRLQKKVDRSTMSESMGDEVLERIPDPYGFWYYNYSMDYPKYFKKFSG